MTPDYRKRLPLVEGCIGLRFVTIGEMVADCLGVRNKAKSSTKDTASRCKPSVLCDLPPSATRLTKTTERTAPSTARGLQTRSMGSGPMS